jgi:hypothetical protein
MLKRRRASREYEHQEVSTMSREQELQQIRETAQRLVDRTKSDAAFREQARQDPAGVALAGGLPEGALPDFLREQAPNAEVTGHMAPRDCYDLSCIISRCPDTCYVTI